MYSRDLLAVGFSLMFAVTPAQSQALDSVSFGSRIRLTTCTGAMLVGTFGGLRGDSIALAIDSAVAAPDALPWERKRIARIVPAECVRTYSVFQRYRKRTGQGALIGAGLGLALFGWAWAEDRAYKGDAIFPARAFAVPAAMLLTGLGALIGAGSGPEQWSPPQRLTAEIRAVPRGIGAGVSGHF